MKTDQIARPFNRGDRVICGCFGITESQIRAYFNEPNATVEEFSSHTGIATKCTACKMDFDLIVDGVVSGKSAVLTPPVSDESRPAGNAWRDIVDSGFLINSGGVRTFVRVDNSPSPFDPKSGMRLTDFNWYLRVISENGSVAVQKEGDLAIGDSLTIDLSEETECPDFGWFWIWLQPKKGGYFGATRPQYALMGPGWVSTVHTQPHSMACYGKSVIIQAPEMLFNTLVSVINGSSRRNATCELKLTCIDTGAELTRIVDLPPNGSRLVAIDREFEGCGAKINVANLSVQSDEPVRKHVIKIQPSAYYSIDHFPDSK